MPSASTHGRRVLERYLASDLDTDTPNWRGKALAAGNTLHFDDFEEGDSPYQGKALEEKKDKIGRRYCTDEGKRVPCPKIEKESKGRAPAKEKDKPRDKPASKASDTDRVYAAIAAQLAKEKQGGDGSTEASNIVKALKADGMAKDRIEDALANLAEEGKITLARVDSEGVFSKQDQENMPRIEGRLFSGIGVRHGEASEAMQKAIDKAKAEPAKEKEKPAKESAKEKPTRDKSSKADKPSDKDPGAMSTEELKAAKVELQARLAAVQAELAKRTSEEKAGKG